MEKFRPCLINVQKSFVAIKSFFKVGRSNENCFQNAYLAKCTHLWKFLQGRCRYFRRSRIAGNILLDLKDIGKITRFLLLIGKFGFRVKNEEFMKRLFLCTTSCGRPLTIQNRP